MDDNQTTVLVAERDDATREFLLDNLAADGYLSLGAQTEQETRLKLRSGEPALLVLGSLAQEHGPLALLRELRCGQAQGDPSLPVIRLGSGSGELELLRAFEAGCDHFVARPFSYLELRARVRACIRRAYEWRAPRRLAIGALVIEPEARTARHGANELSLSRREFELLAQLAAAPSRVFSKQELLREIWGFRSEAKSRTVDAHACRLRRKLALAGAPDAIQAARGVGYRLSIRPRPAATTLAALPVAGDGHAA